MRIGTLLLVGIFLIGCFGCEAKKEEKVKVPEKKEKPKPKEKVVKKEKVAVIETNKGKIVFKFYFEDAPKTCENFIKLAGDGFYNGLTFHRIEKDFVIQGGCPKGDGTGGPGYNIKAEFNKQKHLEGTVAMARSRHPDSAGSQFYICLKPQPRLDGNYTVFGQVIEGMDVVKAIGETEVEAYAKLPDGRDLHRPKERIVMEKVFIEEREVK